MTERCYCMTGRKIPLKNEDTTNVSDVFVMAGIDNPAILIQQNPVMKITKNLKIRVKVTDGYSFFDIKYCPFCGRKLREDA